MNLETIAFEKKGGVAWLTLNRPQNMNAINPQLAADLLDALLACQADASVRAIVLTGAGRAFCAGGDVPAFRENLASIHPFLVRLTHGFHACVSSIMRMEKPVIAAINGVAAGGGMGFALAPDLAIAAESAKFTMAYTGIAATPDGATTFLLPRAVGLRRAMELTLLNRALAAKEAVEWGLINQAVPDDKLAEEAQKLAERLASGPTAAFGAAKRLLWQSFSSTLETQMEEESRSIAAMGLTADFAEGIGAFLEKRKPHFKGR